MNHHRAAADFTIVGEALLGGAAAIKGDLDLLEAGGALNHGALTPLCSSSAIFRGAFQLPELPLHLLASLSS